MLGKISGIIIMPNFISCQKSVRIFDQIKDIGWIYKISDQIPDISVQMPDNCPDARYLAGYQISGRMSDFWSDDKYLAGYQISGQIPDFAICSVSLVFFRQIQHAQRYIKNYVS
mgnify:CR=1 FL=1